MSYKMLVEEARIFDKTEIIFYLYNCLINNKKIQLSFLPEGPCAESCGLYSLLDKFCNETGYPKNNITITTANMLEAHAEFKIVKSTTGWYEIPLIQKWVKENRIDITNHPDYHFGNFVGLSRWPRLWLASWLFNNHKEKTLQTFHSGLHCNYRTNAEDGIYDDVGLDLLNQFDCDIFDEVISFLKHCPIVIKEDLAETKKIITPDGYPSSEQKTLYPLQVHPSLNIIHQYNKIFVDLVIEPNAIGNCFLSTEKIWRCIVAKRPFVIMANNNHLHNLKKLGFKTFNKWINEEYDYYIAQDRIKSIQHTLNIIARLKLQDLANILNEMYNVLEYNYNHFMSLTKKDFQKQFGAR